MKIKKPFIGIIAFIVVLFTMPLGHAAMIIMEKVFGHEYIYWAALIVGFLGLGLLIWGVITPKASKATFLGLFGGLFIWTGWVEFAYVYYANRYGVEPLIVGGEVATKPEYLIMPSSIGFFVIFLLYYLFGTKTACTFFSWLQKKLNIKNVKELQHRKANTAISTFIQLTLLLWGCYLILLFSYDDVFLGDRHLVTYLIAFGALLWSLFLMKNLVKISNITYAIRYSIPTVIIFWTFVEILGRWNVFKEIWIEPGKYWLEMLIIAFIFAIAILFTVLEQRKKQRS